MRIGAKIMSMQVLMAVFILATLGAFQLLTSDIRGSWQSLSVKTVPVLRALENLRAAGAGVFASASRMLVLRHIIDHPAMFMGHGDAPPSRHGIDREQAELKRYSDGFHSGLVEYRDLVHAHFPDELDYLVNISRHGGALLEVARELIALKVDPIHVGELRRLEGDFVRAWENFIRSLDEAIDNEMREVAEEEERLEASLNALQMEIWVAGLILITIGALTALYFSRSLIRPIQAIARASAQVGDGSLEVQLDISSRDEVGELASAFTRMVEQRKAWERKVLEAKAEADQANQAKSRFLAHMSHEIRTPMNAMLGMGELLRETELTEEQQWCVKTIDRSGNILLSLINNILDLSKIEAGQLIMEETPVELWRLVDETMALFISVAADKGIVLRHEMATDVPRLVRGDPTRLRQVLINLVGNAVKFTGAGSVTVRVVAADGDAVAFLVEDTGPGIPAEKQQEIFQPFAQAETAITRTHGGTGLGLTICQGLIDLMGGTIRLESELGRGSLFTFTVPLPELPTDTLPEAGEADDPGPPAPAVTEGSGSAGSRPRILLAEDTEENRLVIQAFLRNMDHELLVAVNGEEAVALFEASPCDLVLMDIQMPIMDGCEATRKIRELERRSGASSTPIIALTAHAMAEESEQILAAGCDLHLTKPVRKQRLLDTIGRFVGHRPDSA